MIDLKTLLGFVVKALLWGLTYYFIRRALNPETKDLQKYQTDAIFGTLANLVSSVVFFIIKDKLL